jgi:hypothetical protein
MYDPSKRTSSIIDGMNYARRGHTASLLTNGKVLITGGSTGNALNSPELYKPSTENWTTLFERMNYARYRHTASVLLDGKVSVTDGYANGILKTAELYY